MSVALTLADGRLVYPDGRIVDPSEAVEELVEVPTNREATQLIISARRKMADLPDVPRTMNTISVVLSYQLFGLDNVEIALATGLSERQVANIQEQASFAEMKEQIIGSILQSEGAAVRELFQQHSRSAVTTMLNVMQKSKSEANKLTVARDFLDRAGHRPADVVEHRHKLEGGLVIEIIRKDDRAIPTIELEVDN